MRRAFAILACLLANGSAAWAATCSVSSTPLSFPPYNAFSGASEDTTSVVTVTCTGLLFLGLVYEVRLDGGQEGDILSRKMIQTGSGSELNYQVYLNAGRSTVWGNGVQGSSFSGSMPLGLFSRSQTRTIYGRIPANQQIHSGAYADTPVMTVIY